MNNHAFPESAWRTSSYSGAGNGNCVEAAFGWQFVGVRDSKNRSGALLTVRPGAWRGLLRSAQGAKMGE